MKKFFISILVALLACTGAFAYQYQIEGDDDSAYEIIATDETSVGDAVFIITETGDWITTFIFIVGDESDAIQFLTELASIDDEEIAEVISSIGEDWDFYEDEDGNSFATYDLTQLE